MFIIAGVDDAVAVKLWKSAEFCILVMKDYEYGF